MTNLFCISVLIVSTNWTDVGKIDGTLDIIQTGIVQTNKIYSIHDGTNCYKLCVIVGSGSTGTFRVVKSDLR